MVITKRDVCLQKERSFESAFGCGEWLMRLFTTQLAVQTNALGSSVETKGNYKNLLSHSVCKGLIE